MATSETPSSLAETAVRRTAWWEPALKARETGLIVIILALFAVMSFGGVLFTMFFLMSSNIAGGVFLVMVIFMVVISQGISLDRARDTAKKREAVSRSIRYV